MLRQLIAEDTMRPARKVDNDPPQKVTDFIQNIISTPLEDIEAPLSRFTWDYDDKGNFHHWTELFVHFNLFFSKYVSSRKDLQLSDSLLDEENSFPKGAVLQILRVLAIIFENCRNKGSFTGLEHFTYLLSSNDPDILLAALHALAALVKINPAKLHLSGKLPGSAVLNRHLLALSQGWGSKEEGLGLFSCVVENGCDEAASQLGSTLHFEFYSDRGLDNAENFNGASLSGLQVIHIPDLHLQPNELVLLKELIDKYQIPSELRFSLWTRIRYTRAFPYLSTRRQYSCIRLLAFMVLMQSSDNHEELAAFFANDPEFMNDLMKVLQSENIIPDNIRSAAIWALGYQFAVISASHERSRVLNVPNIVNNAANRVFLLSLLQRAVMSLATTEVYPISLIEGALYFFLAYVTSSSTSPSPMRETGLIPALLPLLKENNVSHMHLVIFAVKILQKFMDYSNPAVTLFRDLGGLDNTIRRLHFEVTRVVEFSEGNSVATSTYDDDKGQIPYTRRCLIKALLKALGSTTYAPARPPGSEESTLPSSLSLIFNHSHKFGGDIFSSAVTLMSELIHKDPTCFSTLHAAGLTTAFLDAISEDLLLPSSKALCCIPSGLDALCLNNTGLQAVTEGNALQFLVHVFTLRKYLLPLNEGVAHLANSMEELMRHVPSLRGPGVDVIIEILEKVASAGDTGSEAKDRLDSPVPMDTDSEDKHNEGVGTSGLAVENMSNERFLQLCNSHAMVFVHRAMENPETCRIFVEKKGIEALMRFLTLPSIPLSSEGMSVAVHMVAVCKAFTQQHSAALARVFCAYLREHLKTTLNVLGPVVGTNLLAAENGLNRKVFWCLFVVQFFVFLADATRDNRWLAALMAEFGNDSKDVLVDIGMIHREILWQVALIEDSKAVIKKEDGNVSTSSSVTTDLDVHASDIDDHLPTSVGHYVDLILNQHRQSSVWNAEPQIFDLIHLFHDIGHRARLQRRLNIDSSARGRQAYVRQAQSSHSDEGSSRSKMEGNKQKSLHAFCHEILRSLSFHINHLFSELGKVMHLPSRRRDDSPAVSPASKFVASTFATIFLDDLNFDGHASISQREFPFSVKCRYLGKIVDFIQAVIVDRQESCNPVLLNSFYGHGVIKLILTTFEATSQLLWTVLQTPVLMETDGANNDESDKTWIFGTLVIYAGLMDHLATPSCIFGSSSSHFLVQPVPNGSISLPKDSGNFAKVLQSQVLKVVRPVWNHPLFPQCSVEFITSVCSIMKHVYSGIDDKVVKATGGSNLSTQAVGPPLDDSAIAMIVEMGFSRARAEEALRNVHSNRVELAMDWLFTHAEEPLQEDDELARALALSLGSTESSAKEETGTSQKDIDEEEELVQAPSIDEIFSTCVKLLHAKDSLAFPLKDLLLTSCTQNDGRERAKVISFLVEQLKHCTLDHGKDDSMLSLTSHILALILHEDNAACEVAADNGLVSVLLDILSNFCLQASKSESQPDFKYVTPMLLVLDNLLQLKQKIDPNILNSELSKKKDGDAENPENLESNQQNSTEHMLNVPDGYITTEEQKQAIDIVCDFIQMNLPSTTLQALLQLCGRLTRVHAIALRFLDRGGLVALLNLPTSCLFSGFDSVASIIIRHILEDPHTLQAAMESEIRHSLVAALNRNMNGRVSARTFLSNLAPVISRDPAVFMLAAQSVCQVEVVGERPYVILSRDREKEKGKEKEKVLEKDRLGSGDKSVQSDKSPVGNLGNASIKISDVGGKMKGHKRPTHSFASVIEQLLDSVTQYSLPVTNDLGKFISSGSVTDMDVDEIPSEEKGKAVVGRDNLELDGKSSFALARAAFILKLLTEIVLMYPSAVNVILRRDAESSHPRAPLQGVSSGMGHSGPLYHVLHRLLPYSVRHIKEKQVDGEWRQKLSSKASQFLMAICVRSAEGRRRLFLEIVNSFNASICTHVGGFKPPECQMVAFIDLINDVLAARSPSGSNISTEVSKTLIDVGVIQALSSTLENLDLDHPECVKLANGIVKALESLTMEPVQGHEDAQHKSSSLGASGSSVHQRQNERGNEEAPSGDAIAHSQQNETESDQMESSHDAMASVQTVGNLIIESEEDFMNEGGEEDVGVVASFSIEHGGQDSLVDEDEEEEMSGDGVEEDAEDEEEEEEEEDEELDEDDVHHLSHPDADHDDHDVNELGEDYDEDDILEDEEDEDDENNFILRLEDGINVFDHFEVLGRAEGDFPSDPFHVMPIEEVFGANRRTGRTTSIYNLLGRTEDRGTAFQHPLLIGPTAPSRSMRRRVIENDRVVTESNIENTSASSHLDSIFRTLRSGRPGNRLSSWADDSQQLRGTSGTTIALGIEEQFVSQLQRSQPVDDTPSDQAHDTTISQEKGEATASQAADDGAGMTETLQSQENDRTEEREQSHIEDNSASNTNSISTQPSQQASMEQGNQQTTGAVHHDLEMQDERNERVMRDVEAVSQDSSGSGATLGESLRSLEVEIGSADGTGNLGQIDASGNMEGVQDENSNRGPAQPEIVRESSQSVPAHTPSEQQQNTVAAESNSIDPTFLEALPEELRTEVLASQQNQVAQPTSSQPPAAEEIDPEFLAALPPDIQAEVLAQQRAQRLLQSHRFDGHPVDMDSASILATFPPELRTEVLLTSSDAVLANLPEALVTEAHRLRRRFGYDPNDDRFGPFHRGRRHLSGIGGRNVSLGSDRVGNAGSHRTVFGDKLNEADGKPLVDTAALKAMLRLLQLVQPVYKGPLQRLLFNVCTHSVTRATLVQLLLDMLIPDVEGSTQNASSSTSISSYRLYGCLGHVIYSRPQFSDGVPPLVSRRVLETLTYLAQNHPLVANLLLYLEQPDASKPQPDQHTERGKALMIDEESQPETVNKEMTANFPIVLLLKLLNQPLYSRSIAHLEQVMGLLKVIMNNVEVNVQSQSQLTDSGPKPSPQDVTTDAQVDTPGLEMTSQGSTSAAEKKVDPGTVLLSIPETELRLLSSLLACEGLSDLAYSHAADVLMKLVKVAPPHRHLFITELSNAAERLSKVAVGELQCFGEAETMLLSNQLSGAAILRVLQALSSLASSLNKEKDDEVLPDRDHDESVTIIRRLNSAVEPLWQELSLCIGKIENRSSSLSTVSASSGSNGVLPPLPPGTQKILPYIEAFFVTCEKLQPGQMTPAQLEYTSATASEVKEAASSSESSFPSRSLTAPQRKVDEKGITLMKFAERHRRLLNAFVRQNPGLLEKSLSLLLKVPRLIEFDNKRAYFRSRMRQHQDHQNYSSVRISVRRAYILEDSYNQLRMRSARDLKGRLNVNFQGEEGIDAGGLTREWYQSLSRVIFDKGALLFTTVGNEATFQPNPNSGYQTEHLSYFKFIGRVVAKALFDGQLLDVHFTRSFYKHILGVKVTYHDIEAIDPDYYKNLKWMLENDIRDMPDLTFSMDADEEKLILYEREEVTDHELIPGGRNIRVTEENKHEYVDLVAEHRLTTAIRPQINAFLEGFNELIPKNLISIFNDKELELLISGLPEIDLDDLRANTEYAGYSAASPVIQWFWEVVQSFSKEDRARLLQFVTGTSKVPLEGFKALQGISGLQRFQIHKAYGSPDRLPSAHTCFNQLDLPEYPSKEQLEERLLLAIHEASEGFGFG